MWSKCSSGDYTACEWPQIGAIHRGAQWGGELLRGHERRRESELRTKEELGWRENRRILVSGSWLVDRCVVFGVWETIVMEFLMLNGFDGGEDCKDGELLLFFQFFFNIQICISFTYLIGSGVFLILISWHGLRVGRPLVEGWSMRNYCIN